MPPNKGNGAHDDEITAVETPTAIIERCARHFVGVGQSIIKNLPRLAELSGDDLEWLCFALADQVDEMLEGGQSLSGALRDRGRQRLDAGVNGAPKERR
jgi:hypothetical protein